MGRALSLLSFPAAQLAAPKGHSYPPWCPSPQRSSRGTLGWGDPCFTACCPAAISHTFSKIICLPP